MRAEENKEEKRKKGRCAQEMALKKLEKVIFVPMKAPHLSNRTGDRFRNSKPKTGKFCREEGSARPCWLEGIEWDTMDDQQPKRSKRLQVRNVCPLLKGETIFFASCKALTM